VNIKDKQHFQILYFQITELWKRLCEEHAQLFDLTCEEYETLLRSNINELNYIVEKKQAVLEYIGQLDELRADLIKELNDLVEDQTIEKVSDLLEIMEAYELEREHKHLKSFNDFLIDMIEKIQEQNKTNQIFIKKAMLSLKDLQEEIIGHSKKYETYNSKGKALKRTLHP